jgi:hypothetical protein
MHKLQARTYVGQPNETVTLTTDADAGQIDVSLDGQSFPANGQFSLPSAPGGQRTLQVALTGPNGASCAVGIATVDDGTDGDMLVIRPHTPAPVHFYDFSVAAQQTVNALAAFKATPEKAPKGKKAGKKGGGK